MTRFYHALFSFSAYFLILASYFSPGVLAYLIPEERAAPVAPDGYTPARVDCPANTPRVRRATGLSINETDWLPQRTNNTVSAMKDLLSRVNITGIDTGRYIDNLTSNGGTGLPRVAIAISGGGYRALMNGAGALAAFDNRSTDATQTGHLGGLLQSATYLSGLSGGSWLVGSLYVQNFTSVESIVLSTSGFLSTLWRFDHSIFDGPSDLNIVRYYTQLFDAVNDKKKAGFNTSITDYWGRALSYQLVDPSDGGPAVTFSSIANDTEFRTAQAPMPLIVAVERTTGQVQIAANSTVFEFNPWEMGSYDTGLEAFAPLQFVGSNFTNGTIARNGVCIAGVDNAGFVMGTSSSLFNQALLQIGQVQGVPDFLLNAINDTLTDIGDDNRDIAAWPNPFFEYNPTVNLNANETQLTLVDGGEDLQNIPLHPLILPQRRVDVIFAVDGSADTATLWPNGTAMVATFNRSEATTSSADDNRFPDIPDQNTFVNLGLNNRPTFFGCSNRSSGPLIVYLPNAPLSFHSNVSTFDLKYTIEERNQIIQNGYNMATRGNGSVDANWPACVGCAILSRSFNRTRTAVPAICRDCFTRYCWNGTTNDTLPNTYEPAQILQGATEQSSSSAGRASGTLLLAVIALLLAI